MKKIYTMKVMMLAAILSLSALVFAQRTVDVPQGVGTINETIFGDTLDNGSRVDSTTVYLLSDGGTYLCSGEIENRFPLTIKAVDGAVVMPKLYPAVDDGNESSRLFVPRDDLTLIGIDISNTDELGARNKNTIRVKGDEARITLENCTMDEDSQAPFRLDADDVCIFMNNCIISNMDQDYDNGRMIDDRGSDVDTIMITNSSIYNISSRLLRDGGGQIDYFYFDHNTVVNTGRRVVDLGEVLEVTFTNNIMKDVGVLGQEPEDTRAIVNLDSIDGVVQTIMISNNSVYTDEGYTDLQPDSVVLVPWLNVAAAAYVEEAGTGATNLAVDVSFTKGPATTYTMVTDWYETPDADLTAPSFDKSEPFDFGFANSELFSGDSEGGQMGDPRWDASFSTAVKRVVLDASEVSVYPMPVIDMASISFSLAAGAQVQMDVFSLTGQQVAALENQRYEAGSHQVNWNAGNLADGVYLLRMSAGNDITTIKMIIQ